MSLPLSGIKVIDFTIVQAGPACTQLMAWYGADVTKVERPQGGDSTRHQLRDIPGVRCALLQDAEQQQEIDHRGSQEAGGQGSSDKDDQVL